MTSSLIPLNKVPINQASVDELQTLKGIGPKRAERIARYRSEVSYLRDFYDLSLASGLGLKQAHQLSQNVNWSETSGRSMWLPYAVFVGTLLLIVQGLSQITFAFESFRPALFSTALLFIMLACLMLTAEQFFSIFNTRRIAPRILTWLSFLSAGLGVSLLLIYLLASLLRGQSPVEPSMTATANFLVSLAFIVCLLFGPGILLKRTRLFGDDILANLEQGAFIFDLGQLIVAILIVMMLSTMNSNLWVEEFFAIWASVVLASNGLELVRGRSAFLAQLNSQERAALRFVLLEESGQATLKFQTDFMRRIGFSVMVASILLAGIAIYSLAS